MSTKHQIDDVDRILLEALQDDGRITNIKLAEKAELTAPPCLRRVKYLEEQGIIEGYHARINGQALGYGLTAFALVSLKSQAESDLVAFEEHIAMLPEVRECYMLNGEIDFILKIVAHDLAFFQTFLTTCLTTAPNVASVKTSMTIRASKISQVIPLCPLE